MNQTRCLVAVTEKHFLPHYFDSGLIGAQADQECLKEIVKNKLPDLNEHLESIDIDLTSITLNWFLAIFIDSVPFEVKPNITRKKEQIRLISHIRFYQDITSHLGLLFA